ncbi:MAG: hypothetical protein Q4G60_15220 [bacterium]|nr:hypothetical protein [bacterium]
MAYWLDTWYFPFPQNKPKSIEHEYKWMGNYGAKGEKRSKRVKATPEQIKKQNQYYREKLMRRKIKANFQMSDMWTCLKYPKGIRKPVAEVKKDMKKFLDQMRRAYKERGEPFKFIYRMEIGELGGIHIHILVNRLRGEPATDVLMQNLWYHGRVNWESLYDYGGYEQLASYIVKPPDEEEAEQLTLFEEDERKDLIKYSSSRNLIIPEPERKSYSKWTVKKIIANGPKARPGYYIDKNSVRIGVNKFTGLSYLQYTEVLVENINRYEKECLKREEDPPWEEWWRYTSNSLSKDLADCRGHSGTLSERKRQQDQRKSEILKQGTRGQPMK